MKRQRWRRQAAAFLSAAVMAASTLAVIPAGPAAAQTANSPPTFAGSATGRVSESATRGTTVFTTGTTATDADSDTLTYSLDSATDAVFDVSSTGVITVGVAGRFDYEAKETWSGVLSVSDGKAADGTADTSVDASIPLEITIQNAVELPARPTAVTVRSASVLGNSRLTVSWTAPTVAAGTAPVSDYEIRYFAGSSDPASESDWTDVVRDFGVGASALARATIGGLTPNTAYRVQVRAVNSDGRSPWSSSGSGRTAASAAAPANVTTLVSNTGQSADDDSISLGSHTRAQAFTAGGTGTDYILASIDVRFASAPSGVSVKLMTGDAATDTVPVNTVATLSNPASLAAGTLTFTAPGTVLEGGRNYWVAVDATAGSLAAPPPTMRTAELLQTGISTLATTTRPQGRPTGHTTSKRCSLVSRASPSPPRRTSMLSRTRRSSSTRARPPIRSSSTRQRSPAMWTIRHSPTRWTLPPTRCSTSTPTS